MIKLHRKICGLLLNSFVNLFPGVAVVFGPGGIGHHLVSEIGFFAGSAMVLYSFRFLMSEKDGGRGQTRTVDLSLIKRML